MIKPFGIRGAVWYLKLAVNAAEWYDYFNFKGVLKVSDKGEIRAIGKEET